MARCCVSRDARFTPVSPKPLKPNSLSSALVEAAEQLTHALNEIATLPASPSLRRDQIKLQVAFVVALMQTKGHAAPDTKASLDQARFKPKSSENLGRPGAAICGPVRSWSPANNKPNPGNSAPP